MKVSVNNMQFYSPKGVAIKTLPVDELVRKIGEQLGAVEEVQVLGSLYEGIVVAKVIAREKHPNADKLSVCMIDDGGVVKGVERSADGLVQVVCGAPNVRAGLTVAWLPPAVVVPSTALKDPLTLEVREIRGIKSNGMLASPAELAISDDHNGILEIDAQDVGESLAQPGTLFKKLYGLDDVVIDIENKMFTHRPDCFGALGVAREIAGITGQAFTSPDWYKEAQWPKSVDTAKTLTAFNDIPHVVPRFMAQVVDNVTVAPSPIWLQADLTRVGIRPINAVVDWSNFFMALTAQPTHAFDYDKLVQHSVSGKVTLGPRFAKDGETLTLLNGKTISLTSEDMVIATDTVPVALAGVMGGKDTEVDAATKTIVIECATFDMYAIRRTSMRHGLFTDAVTRYTKGQSPLQNDRVLAQIVTEISKSGAQPTTQLVDLKSDAVTVPKTVTVSAPFINRRLGTDLSADAMAQLMTNVECGVAVTGDTLAVTPPFWRTDIGLAEDVVEEVGRLLGFDKISHQLPLRRSQPASLNPVLKQAATVRNHLAAAGANEVLTYSFVHADLLTKVGQDAQKAFTLSNAISPDLQHYRLSLLPSVLDKVHMNIRSDRVRSEDNEFALFEIGKTHQKDCLDDEGLPLETRSLALAFAADDKTASRKYQGAAYYMAQKYLMELQDTLGVWFTLCAIDDYSGRMPIDACIEQWLTPFERLRTALVMADDTVVGCVGEFSAVAKKALKLPDYCTGFELSLSAVLALSTALTPYTPLPKFPKVQQDISLKVPQKVTYASLTRVLETELADIKPSDTHVTLAPLDIYQPENASHKNITYRLWISAYNRTLTADIVNELLDKVATKAAAVVQAERL